MPWIHVEVVVDHRTVQGPGAIVLGAGDETHAAALQDLQVKTWSIAHQIAPMEEDLHTLTVLLAVPDEAESSLGIPIGDGAAAARGILS